MGLLFLALPTRLVPPISARWTSGSSRGPDIDHEQMPSIDANIVEGDGKWVKDTNRFLASASLDSVSSMALIDTLASDLSPLSTPSTSPSSSFGSGTSFSSFSMMLNRAGKSSFAAPMLSPASSTDSLDFFGPSGTTFLDGVFPACEIGRSALNVDSKLTGWSLALVEDRQEGGRTVYAKGQSGFDVRDRENVIALLDHADEDLACDQVVVVLEKNDSELAQTLHSLLYIGGTVISAATSAHSDAFVLVGLEL